MPPKRDSLCISNKSGTECFSLNSNNTNSSNNSGGNTSSYPTGGSYGGGHSSGGGSGTSRSSHSSPEQHIQQVCTSLSGNVLGGAYHDGRKNRDSADGINYQVKGIVSQLNYYGFKDPKGIVLSDCALEDKDTYALHQTLQYYPLNLTVLDLSNNCLGLNSVHTIFYGMRGSQQGDVNHLCKQIKSINLSNNWLGDDSALFISQALEYGNMPNLKSLDVSGNQITPTGEGYFVNSLASLKTQDIAVILKKITATGNEAIKAAIDFTLKGLKYAIDQHAKNQGLIEADTIAVYGGKHCEQALSTSVKVISMGLIKETGKHPEIVKILQQGVWQAKVVAGLGLFALTVGNNLDALATPEMMHCIGGISKNLGLGDVPIDEYTQPLLGDSYDY